MDVLQIKKKSKSKSKSKLESKVVFKIIDENNIGHGHFIYLFISLSSPGSSCRSIGENPQH